jgi:RNA recognition motif-containing protein
MATEDARKLFVAGLPDSITEEALREIFEATGGKVTDVSLPRDRATGRVRGFGFVTFSAAEEAALARDSLDGSLQAGRAISVRPFSSEPPRRDAGGAPRERGDAPSPATAAPGGGQDDRTLYIGNLPYDVTQLEVTQLFTDNGLGAPVRIHLPVGPDGRLRGFGFVTCQSPDAANEALGTLRNLDVRGRRLMVNIAHPRGERPAGGAPRPPRADSPPGGWSGEPRFAPEAPPGDFSTRPADGRRARSFGGGGGAAPGGGGGGGGDWDDKKKKKRGASAGRSADRGRRERGGGGRQWDSDPDDE